MRVRNCPKCYGTGVRGRVGRCGYCHGKKRITSEFVKWDIAREKRLKKLLNDYEERMKKEIEWKLRIDILNWERFNRKPRKFPKVATSGKE